MKSDIPGQVNIAERQYITGDSTNGANYIPGQTPYVGSKADSPSQTYGLTVPATTARCANGDLACISGVGAQQSSLPTMSDGARNAIADGAEATSRTAGVIAAGATAVAAQGGPYGKPAQAIAAGATVIGAAADGINQSVRPDLGKTINDSLAMILQERIDARVPIAAPLTNELMEVWKRSGTSQNLQTWSNQIWGDFLQKKER
ncbi:MAG: hypothetical protein DCF26_16720 [Burkholderiales bacterium]|nr:MAG: hypothetical protein DCF26_16720 [Burkholderiales bacterium]